MAENPTNRHSKLRAKSDYVEIGAAFAIVVGVLVILNQLDFLPDILPCRKT